MGAAVSPGTRGPWRPGSDLGFAASMLGDHRGREQGRDTICYLESRPCPRLPLATAEPAPVDPSTARCVPAPGNQAGGGRLCASVPRA